MQTINTHCVVEITNRQSEKESIHCAFGSLSKMRKSTTYLTPYRGRQECFLVLLLAILCLIPDVCLCSDQDQQTLRRHHYSNSPQSKNVDNTAAATAVTPKGTTSNFPFAKVLIALSDLLEFSPSTPSSTTTKTIQRTTDSSNIESLTKTASNNEVLFEWETNPHKHGNNNHYEKNVAMPNVDIARLTQDVFVSECLSMLQMVSSSEGQEGREVVTEASYLEFLQMISQGHIEITEFKDLPFYLSTIYLSASCSTGRDCISEEPIIVMQDIHATVVLCRQLMKYPFLEVRLPFQFLIRTSNDMTAKDIIIVSNDEVQKSPVTSRLESAISQVLLQGFNCTSAMEQERRKNKSRKPTTSFKKKPKKHQLTRQPQPQHDCDVVVETSINDAADYRKFQNSVGFLLKKIMKKEK